VKKNVTRRGKIEEATFYVYPVHIPRAGLLLDLDPTATENNGAWVNLWREMYFRIFRGRDRQRIPFQKRADKRKTDDADKAWRGLCKGPELAVKMPSTDFLGAMEFNSEWVPFKDRAKYHFLLRFWPYVAQIYIPRFVDNEGKLRSTGYVLAIPDIAQLDWFCEEYPNILRNRGSDIVGERPQRPRECFVDISIEAALDTLRRLRDRIAVAGGSLDQVVLAIDIVHADKPGDSPEIKGVARLMPEQVMIDEYSRLRRALWNSLVKRQRLLNLVEGQPWHVGFGAFLNNLPCKELFGEQAQGFKYFSHDLRWLFNPKESEGQAMSEAVFQERSSTGNGHITEASCETLIYRVVGSYLKRRLKSKYQLEWSTARDNPKDREEYERMKEKVARDAFLSVRSRRSDPDFAEYFASTLCSAFPPLSETQYFTLAKALYEDTDKVRSLTMLALSARG
jgi:CRISPR-associated protein Cmx8